MKSLLWIFLGVSFLALSPRPIRAAFVDLDISESGGFGPGGCDFVKGNGGGTWTYVVPFASGPAMPLTGHLYVASIFSAITCHPFNGFAFNRYDVYEVHAHAGDTVTLEVTDSSSADYGILNLSISDFQPFNF